LYFRFSSRIRRPNAGVERTDFAKRHANRATVLVDYLDCRLLINFGCGLDVQHTRQPPHGQYQLSIWRRGTSDRL